MSQRVRWGAGKQVSLNTLDLLPLLLDVGGHGNVGYGEGFCGWTPNGGGLVPLCCSPAVPASLRQRGPGAEAAAGAPSLGTQTALCLGQRWI